jgi:hypothetical protein
MTGSAADNDRSLPGRVCIRKVPALVRTAAFGPFPVRESAGRLRAVHRRRPRLCRGPLGGRHRVRLALVWRPDRCLLRFTPGIQPAVVQREDAHHPSTVSLPDAWVRTDEWYNFQTNPRDTPEIHVLASLDESSYSGGTMGDHPIAWYHAYSGGRAWYTAGGHTRESYSEPRFLQHVLGGIEYAAGVANPLAAR